jgi:ABC-type nickel/cobalt efflux system permease component RcnA
VTWRSLLALGVSGGLLPCPSALVVLLAAIAQHQIALGLLMIVAFSLGLAATLSALGVAVVWARSTVGRLSIPAPLVAALPAASALFIVAAGSVLTARALAQLW